MRGLGRVNLALAAVATLLMLGPAVAQTPPPPQAVPEPQCQTIGSTTYCKDGTQFDQNQAGQPNAAAAADGIPVRTNIGPTGPTQYQVDNTRIFGIDDRIRRLGETHQRTGQQDWPATYSGRNCFQFNTSFFCD